MILARQEGNPQAPIQATPQAVSLPAWLQALRESLNGKRISCIPLENGYKIVFQGQVEVRAYSDQDEEDKTAEDLKAFIVLEGQRCPFLTLEARSEGPLYVLSITGPDGTSTWLRNNYGLVQCNDVS
jgi:hypothetical protein